MNKILKSILLMMLLLSSFVAKSQIYLSNEDAWNDRGGASLEDVIPVLPQNVEYDWIPDEPYAPVGEGWFLLATMGSVYMIGKAGKKKEHEK